MKCPENSIYIRIILTRSIRKQQLITELAKNVYVKIVVYDILGREVKSLVNEIQKAGSYSVIMDASNLASGAYYYRMEAGDYLNTKKMIIIK